MGLFSFLAGDGTLSERAIKGHAKTLTNPYTQPEARQEAVNKLLKDGSPAALAALLKRFTVTASNTVYDEQEKQAIEDDLVDLGEAAIQPLRDYLRVEKNLTYAARALLRLQPEAEAIAFLLDTLDHYGPEDYRSDEIKLQLIWVVGERLTPAIMERLLPYLEDHADDVRWAVMDLVVAARERGLLAPPVQQRVGALLGALVIGEEFSPRIQRRAAELLADLEWALSEEQAAGHLLPALGEEYFIDKKRFLRRRAKAPRA